MGNIKDYLETLEEEKTKFYDIYGKLKKEKKACEPVLKEIEEKYKLEKDRITKEYEEKIEKLYNAKQKMEKIANVKATSAETDCFNSSIVIKNLKKSILKDYKIDNDLMIKILKATTNLDWKVVGLSGIIYVDQYEGYMKRYGFGLADETHNAYHSDSGYSEAEGNEHFIIGIDSARPLGKPSGFDPNNCDYNWMNDYLLQKGLFPDEFEFFGFDNSMKKNKNYDPIINGIDAYLKNPSIVAETPVSGNRDVEPEIQK